MAASTWVLVGCTGPRDRIERPLQTPVCASAAVSEETFHSRSNATGNAPGALSTYVAQAGHSHTPLSAADRCSAVRASSYRGPLALAAVMCAAHTRGMARLEFSGSGFEVSRRQVGLAHRCPAR